MNAIRHSPVFRAATSLLLIAILIAALYLLEAFQPRAIYLYLPLYGAYDITGHLLTALVVAIGVRALRLPIPVWSILIGGVVLDIGHLLGFLDILHTLHGSSRNGSHSLSVVAALAVIGMIDRRHAHIWLGVAMGATSHLWRDMGTGTVALLWPLSTEVYGTLFNRYLAVLGGITLAMIGSATLLAVHAQAVAPGIADAPGLGSAYGGRHDP